MNIVFHDDCWADATSDTTQAVARLLTTLERRNQHAVSADDSRLLEWCAQHLPIYVELFRARLAAAMPRSKATEILVHPTGQDDVDQDPPWVLSPKATLAIVESPLQFVVENDASDVGFLCAVAPCVKKWQVDGWLSMEMGGGSAMQKRIRQNAANSTARWRTFFLFDSDRLHPSELEATWSPPSGDGCQGYRFETDCRNMPSRRWHRLERRSIENYLPPTMIGLSGHDGIQVLLSTAVGRMAHFYNMKKGLRGDGVEPPDPNKLIRSQRSQGFWTNLSALERDSLREGFGETIADQFPNIPVSHSWPSDIRDEVANLIEALQDAL